MRCLALLTMLTLTAAALSSPPAARMRIISRNPALAAICIGVIPSFFDRIRGAVAGRVWLRNGGESRENENRKKGNEVVIDHNVDGNLFTIFAVGSTCYYVGPPHSGASAAC